MALLVDRDDPSNSTLVGEPPQSVAAGVFVFMGIIASFIAFVAGVICFLLNLRRWWVLRTAPWQVSHLALHARSPQSTVRVTDLDHAVELKVGRLERGRLPLGAQTWSGYQEITAAVARRGHRAIIAPAAELDRFVYARVRRGGGWA